MTDPEANAGDPGSAEPLRELDALDQEPSPRFVRRVIDGIERRQATDSVLELGWWSVTSWLGGMVADLMRLLGVREDKGTEG